MKKLASLVLAGLMLFSFAGCSGGSGADTQPDASPEAHDMAANLIMAQQDAIERLKKHLVSVPAGKK